MSTRHFESFTVARSKLRSVLDAARSGVVTTIARDRELFVVATAESRGAELRRLLSSETVVVPEGGG